VRNIGGYCGAAVTCSELVEMVLGEGDRALGNLKLAVEFWVITEATPQEFDDYVVLRLHYE
jgi:hypothetical protein